ncbi:MAG TPA: branched-chain amino acid ABC transporter substrate-binding protein [Acidimicrobiales bacterium]|nr:branched-chain amino acid ABC transporter substrate-binding protein [Acidimicrobiales bacterium]
MSRERLGHRVTVLGAALLVIALIAASCGGGGQNSLKDKREVAIAFVGAKTGANQTFGLNFRDGARLAIDEENQGGGDLTVRLREFDTAGEGAQARAVSNQFIGDRSVVGVVGPPFTGETNGLVRDLQQAGLVMIGASPVDKDLPSAPASRAVYHRIVADLDPQASGIAEYLSSLERATSVAYVHDGSDYGKQLALNTERKTAGRGVRTAAVEAIDPKSADVSAAVDKIRGSGADTVFYGGLFTEAALLQRKLTEQGANLRFVSSEVALDQSFVDATRAGTTQALNTQGVRLACACKLPLESSTAALRDFYNQYKQKIGREPGPYSAEGYDAAKILIRGIKAGGQNREALLRFVEEQLGTYEGISKTIEFEPGGNLKARTFVVYEVRGGRISELRSLTLGSSTGTTTTGASSTTSTSRRPPTTRRSTTTTTATTTTAPDRSIPEGTTTPSTAVP